MSKPTPKFDIFPNVELFREYCYSGGPYNWGISWGGYSEPVIHGMDFCEYARECVDSFGEIPQPEHLDNCNICLVNQRIVEAVVQEWKPLPDSQAAGLVAQMAQALLLDTCVG